ncbi:proline--tRNA ligase [Sulfurimonas sp. MAG313]|nr:proline--tRNA ligase [Sulfurimonas sp. MAG313]MDF1880266.1 proline--tRNA ligase [Sulfurimonas sp. MAG313]
MRFSRLYAPTSKEAPTGAVLASHIYLSRAGFISQVASGLYNYLPLGKRVLKKIETIIHEEMANVYAQEVELSFVTPMELWEESGRADKFGKELLRFKDRKDNSFVLGPTHEEMMVNIIRNKINSYKQLPINVYQIKTKFRDEARPRFGIMRGREFLMKDAYSFHSSTEDLDREFEVMEATYKTIISRLGLDFRVVEADSGSIGGSGSKELMVIANSGEDTLAVCDSCEYGSNIEIYMDLDEKDDEAEAPAYTNIIDLKGDDNCPKCSGKLSLTKGIEVGHIFKLGTTYTKPLGCTYLDENGKSQDMIMGTYGMGVSRLMAAVIEQNNDDKGCIWTASTAPYTVNILISNIKDEEQMAYAENLYEELNSQGVEVIIDDRKERFGFKMKDAELIGFPYTVIVGKNLVNGTVQIAPRQAEEKTEVAKEELLSHLSELLK